MLRRLRPLFVVLALTAGAPSLGALTVAPATFEELVRESVAVVHGRVRDVRGQWTADRRSIQSTVTLEVIDAFKGSEVEAASFVVPGGEAGGRLLVIPGAPTFRPGDEVVVFLGGRAPALPQPVGLSLGVYRVVADARSAAKLVVPSPVSAGPAGPVRRGSLSRPVKALEAFGADVRAVGEAR
jgi:hypothetical protein